jgi:hypothetical protein
MPAAPPASDRDVRRRFRAIVRADRHRVVATHWRSRPLAWGDTRVTPHHDRRSPVAAGAVLAAVAVAVLGVVSRDGGLTLAAAVVGLPLAVGSALHQARTHVTVTADGRVVVGNGVHRRLRSAPALAVAQVTVPHPAGWSRWRVDRPAGVVVLRGGAVLASRALAHDPARRGDRDRAELLARCLTAAARDAGAVVDADRRARR